MDLGQQLPAELTTFVGRRRELDEAAGLLAESRLLTITGVGGVGKTRLAVALARRDGARFGDGARFADLAPLRDERRVAEAVADAVGSLEHPERPPLDTLGADLADRELLLVLDNCERLLTGCAELADRLLRACPRLTILATSREPLEVEGERTWTLPPLAGDEALELLVDRLRLTRPGPANDADALATLCDRLDGIPLALELAAGKLRAMSAADLVERLPRRLDLLDAGPRTAAARQRTLRATLEWSHDLLDEPERALFRRLAVFAGGFSLEDAEAVCGPEAALVLPRLADKSMLVLDDDRYRMLETLREYARERLLASGEAADHERRHVERFAELAETAADHSSSPRQVEWHDRLAREHDNLRAALARSRAADAPLHARLAAALGPFWILHGHLAEAREHLEAAIDAAPAEARARGRCLIALAGAVWMQGEFERAKALCEEGVLQLRELGDGAWAARGLHTLGTAVTALGDLPAARAAFEESLDLYEELGDDWGLAVTRYHLGRTSLQDGDLESARRLIAASADELRTLDGGFYAADALVSLGILARLEGDDSRAEVHLRESLETARRAGSRWGVPIALDGLAAVAAAAGADPGRALRLGGAAAALRDAVGVRMPPWWPELVDGWLAPARDALTPAAARTHDERGRRMTLDEAVAYALDTRRENGLSRRELEVAELVADGLTNRQIAERLVISVRTAEGHVERVRAKLGFRTRAQIAAWVVENR